MIFVTLDGIIERKFSVDRSARYVSETKDIVFSAYLQEREVFLTRKNLNTAFAGYNKIKANVEPYIISHDMQSFPTILRSIPDKRDPADFLFVNL